MHYNNVPNNVWYQQRRIYQKWTSVTYWWWEIKLSSRKIIGTSSHLNVPSKRMIPTVAFYLAFLQHSYCCRKATNPALLSTESLEMKWFIKSYISVAYWKRFTQNFPVYARLPPSFWQQRIPWKRSQSATKLRYELVNYQLRSSPATSDGTHFSEFINLRAWDT